MSENPNIEELIRHQLGEAEIKPSPGVWEGVRRQLRWKQFARFNPGRWNIYYIAGLLMVGTALVFLSLNDARKSDPVVDPDYSAAGRQEYISNREEGIQAQDTRQAENHATKREVDSKDQVLESEQLRSESVKIAANKISEDAPEKDHSASVDSMVADQDKQMQVVATMVPYFVGSVQSGCVPLTVHFRNQSMNASKSYWDIGPDDRISEWDPIYTFHKPGRYTVTLITENGVGQTASYQQVIDVYDAPSVSFEIEEGFEGIDNHVSLNTVNYSEGADTYSWHLLDNRNQIAGEWGSDAFQPSIKLADLDKTTLQLRLVATNAFGCMDTSIATIPIVVESSKTRIRFPNAFSPSPFGPTGGFYSPHEKRTDVFHPLFVEAPLEYSMKIYTRRGELVFGSRDIYRGWDGYVQQERAMGGVYVWMVEGIWEGGEEFKMHGDLTLIWNEIW